ncbi:alpha/beta hydrolase [Sphingomonas psychrotolerans]|uniref:Alpha/beta hydrolase n=1 Tax=Sphingomonas psychrotolerans TaxID=1327635 RepID=A0ABU3NBR4_9SPHN|nr:alpha/beta hydrolase [Sphingomonas psychrotolerans]MDT8760921.1 alpha/beta hydrolase [Sphingomonas psychrotolerans]
MFSSADAGKDPVDPEIRRFVQAITDAYALYASEGAASIAGRRTVAERVRQPWREGGPAMAATIEATVQGRRVRVHRPIESGELPAMLYLHGGGWVLFSVDTHDRLMREYAARAGIVVIGIDYRLSPEHPFPAALDDCAAAFAWMRGEAASLGIDPERLLVGGDSAGANLAVSLCLTLRDRAEPLPVAMLLNYGAFSPAHLPSYGRFGGTGYMLAPDEMDQFWRDYTGDPALLADPRVAPLGADLHGLPSAFVAIAECDILADCNHALAVRLGEAGVPVECVTYHGATHSFLEAMSISSLADRALTEQATWIRTVLNLEIAR